MLPLESLTEIQSVPLALVKMVITGIRLFFSIILEAFSTKSFQFFSSGILETIHFKLALFATTRESF